MAGAPVRRGVAQGHALHRTGIIAWKFLALHDHGEFGMAVFFAQPQGAQPQVLAETLGRARDLGRPTQRLRVAEGKVAAFGLFRGDGAFHEQFHGGGDRRAEGNRVHAVLVAQRRGIGRGLDVLHATHGADGIGGFIFQAAGHAGIARLALDREMVRIDLGHAAAADGAGEAGLVALIGGLAV